jgi:hypothetical protein
VARGNQLDELGMKFRIKAFQYVRKALQKPPARVPSPSPEHPYPDATIAAILTLITIDVSHEVLTIAIDSSAFPLIYDYRSWRVG